MSIIDEYYNIAPEKIQFVLIPNVSRPVSEGEDMLCDFLKIHLFCIRKQYSGEVFVFIREYL